MTVPMEQIVFFLCVLVRVSAFIYTAPFFNLKNVPQRVKAGFSIALTLILFNVLPYETLQYTTVIDFAALIIKETLAGAVMGFFANVCSQILSFAGHMIDMEIGFSMVNEFDPITSAQVTITANFYSYAVMLMMFITSMHHYIITALVDSYSVIPVGKVVIHTDIYRVFLQFVIDFFIIGFRIVLPIFASMLIVNTVLAILAKVAPQMNMFVIGMQLKVLIGMIVLVFMIMMIPSVSDFIFNEMIAMLKNAIAYLR